MILSCVVCQFNSEPIEITNGFICVFNYVYDWNEMQTALSIFFSAAAAATTTSDHRSFHSLITVDIHIHKTGTIDLHDIIKPEGITFCYCITHGTPQYIVFLLWICWMNEGNVCSQLIFYACFLFVFSFEFLSSFLNCLCAGGKYFCRQVKSMGLKLPVNGTKKRN